jgi:hypothetical protein
VVTITKNAGNIRFPNDVIFSGSGNIVTSTVAGEGNNGVITFAKKLTTAVATTIGGTGKVIFNGEVDLKENGTFGNAVVFNDAAKVSVASKDLLFNGDVTLAHGKALTLNTGTVTLAPGKTVFVGDIPVLQAVGANVVITPAAASATLSAGSAPTGSPPTEPELLAAKTLSLGGAALTSIAGGTLKVLGTGRLGIDEEVPFTTGSLQLEKDAVLSLTNDDAVVSFNSIFTTAGIASGSASTLTAKDGAVTLSATTTGTISGAGAKLVVEGNAAEITVAEDKLITLKGVDLDLSAQGKLILTKSGSASEVSAVTLESGENPGRLTFGSDASGLAISWTNVKKFSDGTNSAAIVGGPGIAWGTADSDSASIAYISASGANSVTLNAMGSGGSSLTFTNTGSSLTP